MHRGYIKLWRRTQDTGLSCLHLGFWSHCLMSATYTARTVPVSGTYVDLQPGQFVFGRGAWSKELDLSEKVTRNLIGTMQKRAMIRAVKRASTFTVFEVINWHLYQEEFSTEGQRKGQQVGQPEGQLGASSGPHLKNEEGKNKRKTPLTPLGNCVCVYCGVSQGQVDWAFERDHFVPRSAGGSDSPENIVDACHVCNQIKQRRIFSTIEEARSHIHWTLWTSGRKRYEAPRLICFGGKKPEGEAPKTVRSVKTFPPELMEVWEASHPDMRACGSLVVLNVWEKLKRQGLLPEQSEILAALAKYRKEIESQTGPVDRQRPYAHLRTWLNQGRWNTGAEVEVRTHAKARQELEQAERATETAEARAREVENAWARKWEGLAEKVKEEWRQHTVEKTPFLRDKKAEGVDVSKLVEVAARGEWRRYQEGKQREEKERKNGGEGV